MAFTSSSKQSYREQLVNSSSTSRVHFTDSQISPEHAGEIVVQLDALKKEGEAHLGFLQECKKYELIIKVPVVVDQEIRIVNSNSHVHVKEVRTPSDSSGHEFIIEIEAIQDKLINDHIKVVSAANEQLSFVLILSANVLGRGQGTPMLKQGIRCIGHESGDDSDCESGRVHRKASTPSVKSLLTQSSPPV